MRLLLSIAMAQRLDPSSITFEDKRFRDLKILCQETWFHSGRLDFDQSLDEKHAFKDSEHEQAARRLGFKRKTISVRDVIHLINDYLYPRIDFFYVNSPKRKVMVERLLPWIRRQNGGPHEYLFFNACLSAMDGNLTDTILSLSSNHYLHGLDYDVYKFLDCLVREGFTEDKDVQKLFTLLAKAIQPPSADCHSDRFGEGYTKRFERYTRNLKTIGT